MSKDYLITSYYVLRIMNPEINKRAKYMLECYKKWEEGSTIKSIYKTKPCSANIGAYDIIRQQMIADGGHDLRCGNPTCHSWCCAYVITLYKNVNYLIYHTREHVYCIMM